MRCVLLALVIAGCANSNDVQCGDLTCPSGLVCSPDQTCVSNDQLAACVGIQAGAKCTFDGVTGFCHDDTCVVGLGICGDAVSEPALGEQCDCGDGTTNTNMPANCPGPNSNDPGATCRTDCTLARCGDGIVDPGESCDDHNTVPFDGCNSDCSGRFEKMETPTGENLNAAWALSSSFAYAVGDAGTVITYDGSAWSAPLEIKNLDVTGVDLLSVWAADPNDVYIAARGNNGTASGFFLRFDGSWHRDKHSGLGDSIGVWGASASDIYVLWSSGTILHSNGTNNDQESLSQIPGGLGCVGQPCCNSTGPALTVNPVSIFGNSATDIYIVALQASGGATRWLFHGDGTSWTCQKELDAQPDQSASAALASDASNWYVVDGQNIDSNTFPNGYCTKCAIGTFTSLAVTSPTELLATGPSGTVMSYDRGSGTWTHLITPTEVDLHGISATGPNNVFIAAQNGIILH